MQNKNIPLVFQLETVYLEIVAEEQKFACDPNVWVDEYSDEFFRFAMYRVKKPGSCRRSCSGDFSFRT